MNLIDELKRARGVGVPLIAVTTADQPHTFAAIRDGFASHEEGCAEISPERCTCRPMILWDCVRGFSALNDGGGEAMQSCGAQGDATKNPIEALAAAEKLPQRTILIVMSGNRLMADFEPMQAILNLRDPFKGTKRTLILMGGPDFHLPAELTQDILMLDHQLPDDKAVEAILGDLHTAAGLKPKPDDLDRSKSALRGLAAFPVEQAAALSVEMDSNGKPARLDNAVMWQRKRGMISQVRGLSMETTDLTFDDIGGLDQWKKYALKLGQGKRRPRAIGWIDEVEKHVAGAGEGRIGDSSGTSQDQMGVLLTEMQERKLPGALFLGPGGSGKSEIVKATAGTLGIPLLRIDLGATKDKYVGTSEQNIRALMKALVAIAGEGGVLFMATCNGIQSLPAALRRRLGRRGMWFVDLPDEKEREAIAKIHIAKYGVKDKAAAKFFKAADGWSGANIHDCCEQADALDISVSEAAEFVVPAKEQDQGLAELRSLAHGKFLSASKPGKYEVPGGNIPLAQPTVKRVFVGAEIEQPESGPEDKSKLN